MDFRVLARLPGRLGPDSHTIAIGMALAMARPVGLALPSRLSALAVNVLIVRKARNGKGSTLAFPAQCSKLSAMHVRTIAIIFTLIAKIQPD
jgi:hypothetical protein